MTFISPPKLTLIPFTFVCTNGNVLTKRSFSSPVGCADPRCDPGAVMKALQIVLAGCLYGQLHRFTMLLFVKT